MNLLKLSILIPFIIILSSSSRKDMNRGVYGTKCNTHDLAAVISNNELFVLLHFAKWKDDEIGDTVYVSGLVNYLLNDEILDSLNGIYSKSDCIRDGEINYMTHVRIHVNSR